MAAKRVGAKGRVIAIDLLEMEPVAGVHFLRGDFSADTGLGALLHALGGKADVVLSDMAPNMSGIAMSDQARSMELAEIACEFALLHLKRQGASWSKSSRGRGMMTSSSRCGCASRKSWSESPRPHATKAPSNSSWRAT